MELFTEVQKVDNSRGTVVIVHGAGEYFGRYGWLARRLNEEGYSVIGGDLPGLGRSYGLKGHIHDFTEYYRTVDGWIKQAMEDRAPVYLLGHSMGGLIAIRYLEEYRPEGVKGVILTSPCLALVQKVSSFLEGVVSLFDKVYPSFRLDSGLKAENVSKDPVIVEQYGTDPLIVRKVSVRWYVGLKKAMKESFTRIDAYPEIPTLIMQAGLDRIVDQWMTRQWAEVLHIREKEYLEWPDLYHEIFNEPEKEEVFAKVRQFLQKH